MSNLAHYACAALLFVAQPWSVASGQEASDDASEQVAADKLSAARKKWAYEFLDGPTVHLELAQLHYAAGRLELAQRICEEARQRFGDDAFDEAYWDVFDFEELPEPAGELADLLQVVQEQMSAGNAAEAKRLCEEGLLKWPKSCELYFFLGAAKDELDEPADSDFSKAVELAPTSPFIQGRVARRLLKKKEDPDAALTGYLRTYFLDPHFYDTEFVESRIAEELGPKRSRAVYTKARDTVGFRTALSLDSYWGTERALQKLYKEWEPAFTADAVRFLAHDSSEMRWLAMQILAEKADDAFEPTLGQLLKHPDLRVRGLSIYLALARRGEDAFPDAREFLASDCPLLRYDTISALSLYGGEAGAAIAAEHLEQEQHEVLKKMRRD